MSKADVARTALLARPGEAREQLRRALETAGVEVVLVADPLETTPQDVQVASPHNIVIAMDAEVEDALDRFDDLFANPRYGILFEESAVVAQRAGWDEARWARHLSAKLLGHGDVLPEGHEPNDMPAPPPAPPPTSAPRAPEPTSAPFAPAPTSEPFAPAPTSAPRAPEPTSAPFAPAPTSAPRAPEPTSAPFAPAPTSEPFAPAPTSVPEPTSKPEPTSSSFAASETIAELAVAAPAGIDFIEVGQHEAANEPPAWAIDIGGHDAEIAEAMPEGALARLTPKDAPDEQAHEGDALWQSFQEFDDAAPGTTQAQTGFRSALAAVDANDVPVDEAIARLQSDMNEFAPDAPSDRWQDFDKPVGEEPPPHDDLEALLRSAGPGRVEDEAPPPTETPAPAVPPVAPKAVAPPSSWSLTDEVPVIESAAAPATGALDAFEHRIASLSLVDTQTAEEESAPAGMTAPPPVPGAEVADNFLHVQGAVLLIGGIGGPDPLRQILSNLPTTFPTPVLVQQALDGGQYDRLVRQMARATPLPVLLAEDGMALQGGHIYVLSPDIGLRPEGEGLAFVADGTRPLARLPVDSSAVVVLSGASEQVMEPLQRFALAGGQVMAQHAEGCYDHAVAGLMIAKGAVADAPTGIAARLSSRWQQ